MAFFEDMDFRTADQFDAEFDNAVIRRGAINLPDGYYDGFVEDFRLHMGKNGITYLKIVIVVLDEDWRGFVVVKWARVETGSPKELEKTAKRIKTDLVTLKYEWKGIRSLGDSRKWEKVKGRSIKFRVTHKQGKTRQYMNIWINRCGDYVSPEVMKQYHHDRESD